MNFDELPEFRRDLKSLQKRFRILTDDMRIVRQVLEVMPDERPPFSFRIDNLGIQPCVIKVKHILFTLLK